MSDQSLLQLAHSCPRCHQGKLFSGLMTLNNECSECGQRFESESGQTWGAMVVAYAVSGAISIPLFLFLLVNRVPPIKALAIPTAVLAVVAPFNVRFSRILWTHAMYHLHHNSKT